MFNKKKWYDENIEHVREYSIQYQKDNDERIKQHRREYYQNNKEKFREYGREYYQNNKEKLNEAMRQYYQDNKEKARLANKKYREVHGERLNKQTLKRNKEAWHDISEPHFFKRRVSAIKSRAKIYGRDFNLDAEYLKTIWPEDGMCPALGVLMKSGDRLNATQLERDCFPSLDRIDATKGYVKGNVHWVSLKANRIMTDGTPAEVMKVALYFQQVTEENS